MLSKVKETFKFNNYAIFLDQIAKQLNTSNAIWASVYYKMLLFVFRTKNELFTNINAGF